MTGASAAGEPRGGAVGVALVGPSGHAARVVAPTIAASEEARLVGVLGSSVERGAELAAGHPGSRAYGDWAELEDDRAVEVVWIAGPNNRHVEFAERCLNAGKNVLLEKPMAVSSAEAERLCALAEKREMLLRVGFQHRFRPGHRWLREALGEGLVGEPRLMRIHRFWPFPYFRDMSEDASESWRSSLVESGGWVLNDIGAHLIDLALWLLDTRGGLAFARTANFKFQEASSEDSAVLVLETQVGTVVTIEVSNAMSSFPSQVDVHGSAGWVKADATFDAGGTVVTHAGDRHEFEAPAPLAANRMELEDFIGGLRGARTIGATPGQAADNVAIIEAAVAGHRNLSPEH